MTPHFYGSEAYYYSMELEDANKLEASLVEKRPMKIVTSEVAMVMKTLKHSVWSVSPMNCMNSDAKSSDGSN